MPSERLLEWVPVTIVTEPLKDDDEEDEDEDDLDLLTDEVELVSVPSFDEL